ncbi:MAG TPA: hypothetical protein VF628_05735 [Allosphingosinicella sp.]
MSKDQVRGDGPGVASGEVHEVHDGAALSAGRGSGAVAACVQRAGTGRDGGKERAAGTGSAARWQRKSYIATALPSPDRAARPATS